jgi:hypothetical protein
MRNSTNLICGLALAAAILLPSAADAQTGPQACGNPFINHYGPFDIRTAPRETVKLVEDFHFTPGVESMTQPKNTMIHDMAQDVEYILKVFPNHYRALITMERLATRRKSDPPPGTKLAVECFFDRALRFRPDDTIARSLYAQFLSRRGRTDDAARQLSIASEHAKDNALSHYNIGLVYFEIGRHEDALKQAHRAQELGFLKPDLAKMLQDLGKWREPVEK